MAAASKKSGLLSSAVTLFETKVKTAKDQYKATVNKIEAAYSSKVESENTKYDEFVAKVEEDTQKRLKMVNKVIDAESEERRWKEDQAEQKKQAEEREAAERKMQEEAEQARLAEEAKQQRIAEKKAAKERKKMLDARAKFPIPPGFVECANSKKLYAKLKKLQGGGRYAFCCFYKAGDKQFRANCEALSAEFNSNVAWFDCPIKEMNFEEAMLLYEFNATPAVVVTREGKPSNLHRYVIGFTEESQTCLRNYAEKADND